MLLLLVQHSAMKLVLSGLSRYVSKITGLVAGRLSALLLILLTATLVPIGDRLSDRTCGGRGGRGVWLWVSPLKCRSYLLSLGLCARADLTVSLIYH